MMQWLTRTAAAALLLAVAVPAGATETTDTDPQWLAWMGCWQPLDGGDDHLLCMRSIEGDVAVQMVTYTDGRVVSEELVRADGQQRPVTREGCNGWESAQFSDDGRRVYMRSEFACEGDIRRSSSGLISMASPLEWMDIQSVGVEGQSAVRVVRYRLATPSQMEQAGVPAMAQDREMAIHAARTAVSGPVTIEHIIDASQHMAPETVEAWVVERGDRLALTADRLLRMADAGVPASVIDLAIAVSYPETFAVNDQRRAGEFMPEEVEERRARPDIYAYPGYYDPFYWDPFRYSRYGNGYYSPYGWGGYGWYPGYRPVIVVVDPDDGEASPPGRVVRGRGYTRGTRSVSEPASGGTYRSPPSSSGTASRPSTTGSSSGSSGSEPRRAKPRGGGSGTGGH